MCVHVLEHYTMKSTQQLTHPEAKRALDEMFDHMVTGIDLAEPRHAPREVMITDEGLTEFGFSLALTTAELDHYKKVAQTVLVECIQPLANAKNIARIVLSENHLFSSGRHDRGFDLVVLMHPDEDVQSTGNSIRANVGVLTSGTVGAVAAGFEEKVPHSPGPHIVHFDHEDVHVQIAVGHWYGADQCQIVYKKIEELDAAGTLKKVHLDQFAIDLFDAQAQFMRTEVVHEPHGENEKFVHGALRLARAWRHCNLSHRDIQFSPFDAWLVMLHAVQTELMKPQTETREKAAGIGGAVSGIRKSIKELLKGHGVTGKIQAGGHEISMKAVFREFLNQLSHIDEMNIQHAHEKIPQWILTQRPLILDPVCPYRNTVFNLHKRVNDDLKKHASESLKMLDDPHATLPKLFPVPTHKKRGA